MHLQQTWNTISVDDFALQSANSCEPQQPVSPSPSATSAGQVTQDSFGTHTASQELEKASTEPTVAASPVHGQSNPTNVPLGSDLDPQLSHFGAPAPRDLHRSSSCGLDTIDTHREQVDPLLLTAFEPSPALDAVEMSQMYVLGREENGRGPEKRPRLQHGALDVLSDLVQAASQTPGPNLMLPSQQLSLLGPLDYLEDGLMLGEATDDFFFHQLAAQETLTPGGGGLGGEMFDMASISAPSDTSRASYSDEITARANRAPSRLLMILREKSEHPTRLTISDREYTSVSSDARRRLPAEDQWLPLTSPREMQHLLNGYIGCFHQHLPIIHLPSLKISDTPSPLIFAMCCIGALYRLERRKARKLFEATNTMLDGELTRYHNADAAKPKQRPNPPSLQSYLAKLCPLWVMQARVLLSLYAALSDDEAITKAEIDRAGRFGTVSRAPRLLCICPYGLLTLRLDIGLSQPPSCPLSGPPR